MNPLDRFLLECELTTSSSLTTPESHHRLLAKEERTGVDMPAKSALLKIFNKTSSNYIWLDR